MPSTFKQRVRWAKTQGLMEFEAYEYADSYSIKEMRTLVYFQQIIQQRRSYINRRRNAGDSDRVIAERIRKIYVRNKWQTAWDRLRAFRKKSIEVGDYIPPPKKGSHHKTSSGHPKGMDWSAGNRKAQKSKAKERDVEKSKLREQIIQAQASGNKQEWNRLQKIWNRKYA
jgi:hypothetical protein